MSRLKNSCFISIPYVAFKLPEKQRPPVKLHVRFCIEQIKLDGIGII